MKDSNNATFPKFLYSKVGDRHFVIHTGFPRFIGEATKKDDYFDMQPEMIDDFPVKPGDEMIMANLMRESGDFLAEYL